jgi:hypothetical protein
MNTHALIKVKNFLVSNAFAAACAGYVIGTVFAKLAG